MGVKSWFEEFDANLRLSDQVVAKIQTGYDEIVKTVNGEYWNSQSDIDHAMFIGAYGRGTAIDASGIEILVSLPQDVYERFLSDSENGQVALLEELKGKLAKIFPSSEIKEDGQAVAFSVDDDITFEVIPGFLNADGSYDYPDTIKGSWQKMDPKETLDSFHERDGKMNCMLKTLSRIMQAWSVKNKCPLEGNLMDAMVYDFFKGNQYAGKSLFHFDFISEDFFDYLRKNVNEKTWHILGTTEEISPKNPDLIQKAAHSSYKQASQAIFNEYVGHSVPAQRMWRLIFGPKFPS